MWNAMGGPPKRELGMEKRTTVHQDRSPTGQLIPQAAVELPDSEAKEGLDRLNSLLYNQ
jgi:hypothetical protein